MTSRIFISYRREDSDSWVGRLADEEPPSNRPLSSVALLLDFFLR